MMLLYIFSARSYKSQIKSHHNISGCIFSWLQRFPHIMVPRSKLSRISAVYLIASQQCRGTTSGDMHRAYLVIKAGQLLVELLVLVIDKGNVAVILTLASFSPLPHPRLLGLP